MTTSHETRPCPDCDEPALFTFSDTAGLGAQKQGDGYNTTPDSAHYVCLPCAKAWKQRLDGPLTPDIVGNIAFFACKDLDCGRTLAIAIETPNGIGATLSCANGHVHEIIGTDEGGLIVIRR